jgi:hypothetical protein
MAEENPGQSNQQAADGKAGGTAPATPPGDTTPKGMPPGMPPDWAERVAKAEQRHGMRPAGNAEPKAQAGGDDGDTDPTQKGEKADAKDGEQPTEIKVKLPAGVTQKQWDKAVHALKRDGWEDDDIAALAAKHPNRIIAMGDKRAENQADVDRKLKIKETKGGEEAPADKKTTTPSSESAGGKSKNQGAEGDTAARAKANLDKLRGTLGEKLAGFTPDEADALAASTSEFTEAAITHATAPLAEKLAEYESEVSELRAAKQVLTNMVEEVLTGTYRKDFLDDYPQLKDNERFTKLTARLEQMRETESESFDTYRELFAEGCAREFSREIAEQAKKDRAAANAKRNNGALTPPSSTATGSERRATKAETQIELVKALESGDKERARSLAATAR